MRQRKTSSLAASILAIAALSWTGGCGGSYDPSKPALALAFVFEHQQQWESLEQRFAEGSKEERIAMAAELRAFSRTPSIGRSALPLYAWSLLEKGDIAGAEKVAAIVRQGRAGPAHDTASVVRGAAMRRKGRPAEASKVLAPLIGKVIDPYARDLLNEEVALAALESKRYREALDFMTSWLRDAEGADREAVTARLREEIGRIPNAPLLSFLERTRRATEAKESTATLSAMVAQSLAKRAGDKGDVGLARQLIDESRDLLGEEGDTVAELAVGQHAARVDPRVVGLLLPLGDGVVRRRGIEVASGVSLGLGGAGAPLRVLTRDDGGDVAKTADGLASLSALGASVVVAGFDEPGATEVARYAQKEGLVAILLRPPRGGLPASAFRVGPDPREVSVALRAALAERGVGPSAGVADEASLLEATIAGSEAEPLCAAWTVAGARDRGARSAVVLGDVRCGERVARSVGGDFMVAFGLEAAEIAPAQALVASAGSLPVDPKAMPPTLEEAVQTLGAPPTYWLALGRDAGALARVALEPLVDQKPAEGAEVAARRATLVDALGRARADLWTSEATGFSDLRTVPRAIAVRPR